MEMTISRILKGSCAVIVLSGCLSAQQKMPQTTTQRIKGASTTSTQQLSGTVVQVEGNTLVARTDAGDIRTFTPPESRRFIIDGRELRLQELKPGTKLKATVTTVTTSVTERTTTVGGGKVWYVAAPNVILTLPNGENRQYKVKGDYKFTVDGRPATVFELRKGMVVSAEKIVEVPAVEIASDTTVTGSAPPPPRPVVARAAAPSSESASAPAPAPARRAEPAAVAPVAETSAMPTKLPKTASPLPLIGLAGLLCGAASLLLRRVR